VAGLPTRLAGSKPAAKCIRSSEIGEWGGSGPSILPALSLSKWPFSRKSRYIFPDGEGSERYS
jgi:hypothetical protein